MTFLTRSMSLDPGDSLHALLSLQEEGALGAALNAMELEDAATAVERAPTLEDRGRLLWALAPDRRAGVLSQLHPGFIGALIQNREEENKRLLGDLSREQFTRLLRYCSPERAFYWLALATSFPHARANMLPLLVPVEELAAAMLSVPEFALHCQEVGDYSVGDLQLEQDDFLDVASATVTVFGPAGSVIEEFPILEDGPVRDPRLRHLLHTLEHHPDRYSAIVTIISVEGSMEELPLQDRRLRRLMHRLLDYDLEQYTAILNLFGPEGVLKEFPIRDRRLHRLLQTVLDTDPQRYVALVQAALQLSDYGGNHPEERELLREAPLLLDGLLSIDEERSRAGVAPPVESSAEPPAATAREPSPTPTTLNAEPMPAASATPAPSADLEPEGGDDMSFLTHSTSLEPGDPVHALLSLEEAEALGAAVNAMELEEVTLAVGRAPTLEERSRLVWALTPARRAEVLDQLHPGFVGALIQNREAENKALLGDLSREQFSRLLRYCSPERAYYWLTLVTSFEDARADMLPLLVPIRDLAAALLTQTEFETHCESIGDYSIENLGVDLAQQFADTLEGFQDLAYAIVTVFGADGMLREFPIKDLCLRRLLQTVLDQSPEHYAQLIHTALGQSDYSGNHPEEQEVLQDEPILLEDLLTLGEERSRAGLTAPEAPAMRPRAADVRGVPSLPVRRSAELMRAAASALPAQRQNELSQELQLLYMQEAAYAGGSFAQADLEQAAGRVQSYVQLGLAGLADGDTEQAARLLSEQRLRTLMESGARQVERLRQVALRLLPWREVLDKRQLRLLEGLEHPDMGVEEDGRPVLRLRPVSRKRGAPAEAMDLEAVRVELEGISAWITLVRAVGKARIARRMVPPSPGDGGDGAPAAPEAGKTPERRKPDAAEITRSLVVAAVLYRHWDPALVEPADLDRFRETYLDPSTGRFNAAAFHALAEAVRAMAAERKLDASAVQEIARLLARAMEELAAAEGEDQKPEREPR